MSSKKIAICDCNNFYVSCERLFNPRLLHEPTVVLSNNDGCVIARSQEIKKMGVKMGQPLFQLTDEMQQSIHKFSSNYVLYGDISDRISNILKRYTPRLEIYSIDESFLDLSHIPDGELLTHMSMIRADILRLTGIPVSIGVAPNKTLAKLMNLVSKTDPDLNGVCSYWSSGVGVDDLEVGEVWGIGQSWRRKLHAMGIERIGQFKELDPWQVRKLFTIVGLRTWMELHGELVHQIETSFKKPKAVTSSRSFGKTVWQRDQIKDAIWTFLEDAAKKMQVEKLKSRSCVVFCTTNRHKADYLVWMKEIRLYNPSNDVQSLYSELSPLLEEIPIKPWAKAGVMFLDLIDVSVFAPKIFLETFEKSERPKVNSQDWLTRRDFLSPRWTTQWQEIPELS